ncbi:MAG: tripartite tricarboxylate transporter substrate binding protein [Xanthobacteraceae bacterium]|nr:tripartite tricarboxylate transporter substrate binding protein [Xanthobacteraceae bacterium]
MLALVALACPTAAGAQAWPAKPIEWIVPFAPGGSGDALARLVAEKLKDRLGQPIVIVNRAGANGDIGYKAAAAATPDGHTIVLTVPALVTNPFQLKAALDPSRLAPVIYLADGPYVMLASQKFPATTIQEAIARIQAKPGSVSCGMTGGTGSVACQALQVFAKSKMLEVPYRGVEPATVAIMAGDIDTVFSFSITAARPIDSGRVKALATTALKRGSLPFPELPAISEVLPGFEILGWSGVAVPAGTPGDVVARLNREMNAVLQMSDVSARLKAGGLNPVGGTSEDFVRQLKVAEEVQGKVLKASGVTPQ